MTVVLYSQYYKERNATNNPTYDQIADGIPFTVQLKDDTSIINPVLIFSQYPALTGFPSTFNYAKIADFDRFYFIDDWTSYQGRWEASLTVDPLGSWRDDILYSTQYVLRAARTYDGDIQDTLYPITSDYITGYDSYPDVWQKAPQNGTYVLGVVGSNNTYTNGCVTYYAMNYSVMSQFIAYLNSEDFLINQGMTTLEQVPEELVKAIWDPMDYVISCKWFPVPMSLITGTSTTGIYFGWYSWSADSSATIKVIGPNNTVLTFGLGSSHRITLPEHPQISRGDYLHHAPYSIYTLKAPPFSDVIINTAAYPFDSTHYISRVYYIDLTTGACTQYVSVAHAVTGGDRIDYVLAAETIQLGVDVSLAKIVYQQNKMGLIAAGGGVLSEISNSLQGIPVVGDVARTIGKIGDAAQVLGLENHIVGQNGSFAIFQIPPCLQYQFNKITAENREHSGRPLCDRRQLITLQKNSDHSGYVVVGDPDIDFPATSYEIETIKNAMINGVYLA